MAKKSMLSEVQDTVVHAAKTGAEGVKSIAADATGAAASAALAAAAGVVVERISEALAEGKKKVDSAALEAQNAAAQQRPDTVRRVQAQKTRSKAGAKKKAPAKTKAAAKKKSTRKSKVKSKSKTASKKRAKTKRSARRRP
jgi:colicin import membrane protein